MSIETAITVNIISTFMMIVGYSYLYYQYRYPYLAKWVIAWAILAARQITLDRYFIMQTLPPSMVVLYGIMSASYSLALIFGSSEFANKRISDKWLVSGLVCAIAFSMGVYWNLPFEYYAIPGIVFMSLIYIATGLIFLKIKVSGIGKTFTAVVFILLGIHLLDMPILFSNKLFAPWGFLIDGMLKFLVALGIIFVYFEKVSKELYTKENYYRLITENATDVIYRYKLIAPRGFEYISPSLKKLTGYNTSDFKNLVDVLRIIHPDDIIRFKSIRKSKDINNITNLRIVNKNGEMVWAEQKNTLVLDDSGKVITIEGIVRDVTSRVLLEQDISRLDRLNIAGQMATSLAHEIRNPLSTVRGYIQLMGNRDEFEDYKERLNMMLDEIDRTNGIITEYLLLSKNKRVDMKAANLNKIIKSIHPLIEVDAAAFNVEVKLSLADIPDLPLDDNEIKQMLLNFVRNGIEAMPGGGVLVIGTSAGADETILSISDQGEGIPPQVMDNMGKPFLTTKDNGTGLGMAVCYRIAGRHNAKIEFDTGNKGTTVFVKFNNR